ncbi:tetratricopeptide repeat protein [Streptomyces sp. NPDC007991]|uniref:tetratricopeptide repeat protein n=1 Tax=Streptomyces sp. NPDC007991 TaxID=3364803 RepID=UPI0036EB5F80
MSTSAEASGDRSIAAGHGIRQALSGDGSVGLYTEKSFALPPEAFALPDTAPPGLANLPDAAALFVGRARELALLDEALRPPGGVVVQAVHGLGGIGKSTLAARWAAGRSGVFNPVWWINAETPADLDAGLADLAVALRPALRDVQSRDALRERAVQWLAAHEGWLVVLDNVSSPLDIKPLLARAAGGRFLITTRRAAGWHGIAEPLSLDVLQLDEAVELFGSISGHGPDDDVTGLCGDLGCLPLAVEQAAAYCTEAGIAPGRYRELLAQYPEEVFAQSAEGADGERTVARIWRLTLDRLSDTPLAGAILRIIAWWAPEGIPRSYLEPLGSPVEVTDAVRRLAAYSMISLHDDGTISVHRLVQAVTRAAGVESAHGAANLLLLGSRTRDMAAEMRWLTHVDALASHLASDDDGENEVLLFESSGLSYTHLDVTRAIALHERALEAARRVYGPRGTVTLRVRADLAQSYGVAGDKEREIGLLERNLADYTRVFGRRDTRTFEATTELARVLSKAGRLGEGLALAEKNARKAERVLGRDAYAALRAWSAWASALGDAALKDPGRHAAAAREAIEELLPRAVAATGLDSPVSVELRLHLAWTRRLAGDTPGAKAMYEEYVESQIRGRGATDRYALTARTSFVRFLWKAADDPAHARQVLVPLLADWERVLGDAPQVRRLREEFAPLLDVTDASP